MTIKFSILAAAVAAVLFCSCASTTFEVPKIGTRFDDTKKYLVYDDDVKSYVIPLDKYKVLQYERFSLKVPTDEVVKYYAPALSNSSNHAELYVRNLPIETDFFGRAIYAPNLEEWKTLSDIEKFYKEKYTPDKYTISLKRRFRSSGASPASSTTSWRVSRIPARSSRSTATACSTRGIRAVSSTSGRGGRRMRRTSTTIS